MVSRKRSKGQARRAKAIEKEMANKMREYLKVMNGPRETPQLVPSLQGHVFWSNCSCRHGLAQITDLHIEEEIIRKFTNDFTTVLEDYSDTPLAWASIVEMAYLRSYGQYLKATIDTGHMTDLSRIVSFLLASGTQHLLDKKFSSARDCAFIALAHEQYNEVYVKKTRAFVNTVKLIELYLADDHTLISFFNKRIECSCLYEKYKKVKSIPKMGICFNTFCSERLLERQKTKCCSRCRVETYCSRVCQSKHWEDHHKTTCDRRESKKSRAQN